MKQINTKSRFRVYMSLLVLLLLLKLSLFIYFPLPNPDGPWSLSHTFSILNGHFFESSFAHSYMGFYNLPYLVGLLNAPFYLLFKNTGLLIYSIFLLNMLWICLTLVLAFYILKKSGDDGTKFFLFAFSFILSIYTYSLRPEILLLPLLLLLQVLLDGYKNNKTRGWLPGLITAVIGLIHPVGGFYAVFFISIYCIDNYISFKKLLSLLTGVGAAVLLLYGPVVFYNIELWKLNFFQRGFENDTRHIDFYYPVKFYYYSLPFLVLTVYTIWLSGKKERLKETFYLFACIVMLMLFMRSYYLPYLFHFVCWRLSLRKNFFVSKNMRAAFSIAVLAGLFVCLGITGYQQFENRGYRNAFMQTLDYVKLTADKNNQKLIWVPPILSMSIIDKPNARLYIPTNEQLSGSKQVAHTSSIYLVAYKTDINTIRQFETAANDSIIVRQVYAPVKGLLRFGIQNSRTDSLGLWMITAIKK